MQGQRTIVVVTSGADSGALDDLPVGARVVAADGGVDAALAVGLEIAVAVGDFDSVTPAGLASAAAGGASIRAYPAEKDATDLELALDVALELRAEQIVVAGGGGGRIDHLVAGLLLLGHERYAGVEIDARLGRALVHVVRTERALAGDPGELISLLPLHGPAAGVITSGLTYPLKGETIAPGSSRGVSNVFEERVARIAVARGVLVALRPGTFDKELS